MGRHSSVERIRRHETAHFVQPRGMISDASSTHQMQNEHDEGDHQYDVDEPTGNVQSKTTAPQDQKNDGNNQKHDIVSAFVMAMAAKWLWKCVGHALLALGEPPLPRKLARW